jgi:hypothetical protein
LFVIVLFAIVLGLRHDEFHDVKGEHFKTDLHNIPRNVLLGINSLVINIMGKSDDAWNQLQLWAQDVTPDLCPLRHLLVYLHCIKFKSGYIFPPLPDTDQPAMT